MKLQHRERMKVEKDGEKIDVWNYLNVDLAYQIRGESTKEMFPSACRIEIGGSGPEPDYVTPWVADHLWREFNIDLDTTDEFDIEVIDIESDEVTVL